jgi:hypothetical protein
MSAGRGLIYAQRGGPGDPARVAGRPGGHQRRPGRPGHLCRSTRRGLGFAFVFVFFFDSGRQGS